MSDNRHIEAPLQSGQIQGKRLDVEEHFPEGVVVKTAAGEKQFLPQSFLDLLLLRNRGRGQ